MPVLPVTTNKCFVSDMESVADVKNGRKVETRGESWW